MIFPHFHNTGIVCRSANDYDAYDDDDELKIDSINKLSMAIVSRLSMKKYRI